jgi:quercetin dioxygenase-like cupin family protein
LSAPARKKFLAAPAMIDHNKGEYHRYSRERMDHAVHEAPPESPQLSVQPTIGGSVYVKPQDIAWEPTQFDGISIKILYEDKAKGEMTCLLKWEPGATLPMHKHPEIEQTFVLEGSFYDHDGICRAGEFVWRRVGSFHETRSDEGAIILAVYRKPNVFRHSSGYACK